MWIACGWKETFFKLILCQRLKWWTMEQRLAEYRAQKQAAFQKIGKKPFARTQKTKRSNAVALVFKSWINAFANNPTFVSFGKKLASIPILGTPLALKVILWLLLFGLFVELEFGMVFVVLSAFGFIYLSTSTRRRKSKEMSAYSVFNEGCERLDGTFTAEQFENELRHRISWRILM